MDTNSPNIQDLITKYGINLIDLFSSLQGDINTLKESNTRIEENTNTLIDTSSRIENKVDSIQKSINMLISSFSELKQLQDDLDRKIVQLSYELSNVEKTIDEDELEASRNLCRNMYLYWEEYEELTRKLLPVSEYLFKKLQKYNQDTDYSPVCLEICRGLEYEIKAKVFREYVFQLIQEYSSTKNLDDFLAEDQISEYYDVFEHKKKPITSITGPFQKKLYKAIHTPNEEPFFTLGEMQYIFNNVNKKPIREKSKLLMDFYKYLTEKTNIEQLLNSDFTKQLEETISRFRNPAAHPNSISLEIAIECRNKLPEQIDFFEKCLQ